MYIPPILFVSFFLASLFISNNQSGKNSLIISKSTSLNKQIDSTPTPKIRTIKVHNYLTPMPLSELGDSVLNEFLPSLEGTIIATKEFKERYDMTVKHISKVYKKDALSHGRFYARILATQYLAHKGKSMYQIDSLLAAYYLSPSLELEGIFMPYKNMGYDLTKMSGKRKTTLAVKDTLKEIFLAKIFSEALFDGDCRCMDNVSDFGASANTIHYGINYQSYTLKIVPKYFYPYLPSSCNKHTKNRIVIDTTVRGEIPHLKCAHDWPNVLFHIALINPNIKQPEPYIMLYSPQDSDQVVMQYNVNPIKPKYTYNYRGGGLISCLMPKQTYYFLAMAESTDGQMLAGIRPFMVSDTTHYEMELQPMKWEDFNAAVNALK